MTLKPFIRYQSDSLEFLSEFEESSVKAAFFDPQYKGVLATLAYGNEGARQATRFEYSQMPEDYIIECIHDISRVLKPSAHLFLWVDKYLLVEGTAKRWAVGTDLHLVDMIIWDKLRIGMGYRSRSRSEYLITFQKEPKKARMTGVWKDRGIPDVWQEKVSRSKEYPHTKPIGLIKRLIECVTEPDDLVIDPAAGSYTVMTAAKDAGRLFMGCDLLFGDVNLKGEIVDG